MGARMNSCDGAEHLSRDIDDSACVDRAVTRHVMTTRLPRHDLACPIPPPS